MNDISAIASVALGMTQSQTQDQIAMSVMVMQAQAEQALADMIMQNARQIAALSHLSSGGVIDIFA